MQRKKKVKGLVIGVTLLSLITAGCGAGNDNSSNKEQASPKNTAVVENTRAADGNHNRQRLQPS